jgi:hypothetical protein
MADGAAAGGAEGGAHGGARRRRSSPGIAASFRAAAADFYYQSVRLVPANLFWGLSFLAWLVVSVSTGPLVTLALAPLLTIPYVGVVRLAALTTRGQDVVLSDVVDGIRRFGLIALVSGAVGALAIAVLASDALLGANLGGPLGWVLSTLGLMGLLALWVFSVPFWVLLVDPDREGQPVRARVRIAALLVIAAPVRLAWLSFLLALLLFVSTIAFVALLTIAPAYAALVAARFCLPLADRLERWLDERDETRRAAGGRGTTTT